MPYLFLPSDLEKLQKKREMINSRYRQAGKEAGEACDQGSETWHDNAAYHIAMTEMHLQGQRLAEVDEILRDVQIVQEPISTGRASIGHHIHLRDVTTGEELWYFLGSYAITDSEEDLSKQNGTKEHPYRISYVSPIGRNLSNKKRGDTFKLTFQPRPPRTFEIIEIV